MIQFRQGKNGSWTAVATDGNRTASAGSAFRTLPGAYRATAKRLKAAGLQSFEWTAVNAKGQKVAGVCKIAADDLKTILDTKVSPLMAEIDRVTDALSTSLATLLTLGNRAKAITLAKVVDEDDASTKALNDLIEDLQKALASGEKSYPGLLDNLVDALVKDQKRWTNLYKQAR